MKPKDLSSIVVVNLTAIQTAIEELQPLFSGELALWRGHGDFGWKLQPHVFRPTAVGARSYDEPHLLLDFQAKAHSRYPRCPRNEDRIDWLTLARHYGLPTRLLDWSWSPLTALYFALDGENDGCLWALSPERMNSQMGRDRGLLSPEDMAVQMIVKIAFQSDPSLAADQTKLVSAMGPTCTKALAINMREIDARVFAQQAACTIHLDASDLSEIDCTSGAWKRAFRVPKDAKPKLRDLLRNLGISKSLLFPDLHSLADDLKSK